MRRVNLLLVVFLMLGALLPSSAVAAWIPPRNDLSPQAFLNPDGTLSLPANFSGAFDLTGWDVRLDGLKGPVLSPLSLNTGDWVALSSAAEGSLASGQVNALAVIGTDLYVGGTFTNVTNSGTTLTEADRIAKWDGSSWSALGSNGAADGSLNNTVSALAVIGTDLYVGGSFTDVNNSGTSLTAADRIAKWDGSNWSALGVGTAGNGSIINGQVNALVVIGSDLYVGGTFTNVNNSGTSLTAADRIAKWDGSNWSALGSNGAGGGSLNNAVSALAVIGTDLYVGGTFTNVNNSGTTLTAADRIAKWDGSDWSALSSNGAADGSIGNNAVLALVASGSNLYVGGSFINVNNGGTSLTAADRIAEWDGSNWSALGSNGAADGSLTSGQVNALAVIGTDVYVGGTFTNVNDNGTALAAADRLARWDGSNWSALGSNGAGDGSLNNSALALAVLGGDLYVGGSFTNTNNNGGVLTAGDRMASWDGSTWSTLGSGASGNGSLNNTVLALAATGGDLYVGGSFTNVNNDGTGLAAGDRIAKWDGSDWSALGTGVAGDGSLTSGQVNALAVIGADLYVGGTFTNVNNSGTVIAEADRIAKWDGSNWSALGSNGAADGSLNNTVLVLAVLGTDLYVGGTFTDVNNSGATLTAADRIAKWDGSNWSALGVGSAGNGSIANGQVNELAVIGSDLYVGGTFTNVNNSGTSLTAADRIAKWDGSNWSALGSNGSGGGSLNNAVSALAVIGTDLYVGGTFTDVNNSGTSLTAADRIAKWDGSDWSALGVGAGVDGSIANGSVTSLAAIGSALYVGGSFTDVNNSGTVLTNADRFTKWDGSNWLALGSNGAGDGSLTSGQVNALMDIGTDLFLGGSFSNVNDNGTVLAAADFIVQTGAGSPAYSATPPDGATLAFIGPTGSSPSLDISVTNSGGADSELDVSLTSISLGYTVVSGLPIDDLQTTDPPATITVQCDSAPQIAGALVLATNDPANTSVTYDLTCTAADPTYSATPPDGSTLTFIGPIGSTPPSLTIEVSNSGDPGSQLDVSLNSISFGYSVSGLPINDQGPTDPPSKITVQCDSVPRANGTLRLSTNDTANPDIVYHLTCQSSGNQKGSQEISSSGETIFRLGRIKVIVPLGAIPSNETGCRIVIETVGQSGQFGFTLGDTVWDVKIICDSGEIEVFLLPITVCIRPTDGVMTDKQVFHRHGEGSFTALPISSLLNGYVCGTTQVLSLFTFGELSLPDTGFAPGGETQLGEQPPSSLYVEYDALMLEIPQLDLIAPIWGVPQGPNGWDVSWLGENAGYLYGTAYPTWVGNSVLTAHVWNADNSPGPFYHLRDLEHGDQFFIHSNGITYVYEVRSNRLVSENNLEVMKASDYSLITLVTCESFNESGGDYLYRRAVQAVLVEIR
ncbi:MAG: sortase [Anaerolineales bacterium]